MAKVQVIGGGIWGLWTAHFLLQAEHEVTLAEMRFPGQERSGSGGQSRIFRRAYGKDFGYTDMAIQSFRYWMEFFKGANQKLYFNTGLLWLFSGEDCSYVLESASYLKDPKYGFDKISEGDAEKRYPGLSFRDIRHVFFEKDAGLMMANRICREMAANLHRRGLKISTEKVVIDENQIGKGNFIYSDALSESDFYVFACGPWSRFIFPKLLSQKTYVSRQEVYFLKNKRNTIPPGNSLDHPPWIEYSPGTPLYYGIPPIDNEGYKFSYDSRKVEFHPEEKDLSLTETIYRKARKYLDSRVPGTRHFTELSHRICPYDNSLDGHFIVDTHPENERLILLAGSSGHGFKMAPAVGKMVLSHIESGAAFPRQFGLDRLHHLQSRTTQFL